MTSSRQNGRTGFLVFLLSLVLYLATTGGSMATDIMSYEVAKNIVEHGSVAMSYNVQDMDAHRGVDGRYYAPYGIGHALYAVPFYLAGRLVEDATGLGVGKSEAIRKAFLVLGNAVAGALTVWLAFLFSCRLGGSSRAAVLTAMTLGFGTFLWPYSKFGFSAPLTALTVLWGLYGVWAGTRDRKQALLWLGGCGLGCALLVRHELALAAVPVGVWIVLESRGSLRGVLRKGLPVAVPVLAAAMLTLCYNHVRFGSPWDTGYLRDGTATFGSIRIGLLGLLASPGRSLFLFAPVTVPGVVALGSLWKRDRATAVLLGGTTAVLVLFYASLTYWDADRSYGPRYLVTILPLLCVPLVSWFDRPPGDVRRRVLIVAAVLSVIVQLPGILVDFSRVSFRPEYSYLTREDRLWTWEGSALRLNARAAVSRIPSNVRYLAGIDLPPRIQAADARARDFSEQFAFSLDFWWLYLFYAGVVPTPVAVTAATLLLASAAWIALILRRRIITA
jgi:hypothetical protein